MEAADCRAESLVQSGELGAPGQAAAQGDGSESRERGARRATRVGGRLAPPRPRRLGEAWELALAARRLAGRGERRSLATHGRVERTLLRLLRSDRFRSPRRGDVGWMRRMRWLVPRVLRLRSRRTGGKA